MEQDRGGGRRPTRLERLLIRGQAHATRLALRHGVEIVARLPDRLVLPAVRSRLDRAFNYPDAVDFLYRMAVELKRRYTGFHPNVRRRFVENLFGETFLLNGRRRRDVIARLGHVPRLMVISPTMRCNLRCKGCYSAHYKQDDVLDTATLHRILGEAKDMGVHFVVVSGGEPFLRADLLELFERHQDVLFLTYTNGTLLGSRGMARALARLGNVMPAISVEGFAEQTDARRGRHVHGQVVQAMKALRREGVAFGFSATPMRHNSELLVSDEFVRYYVELGAFFGWYFSYIPVGRDADLSLMPTPAQRAHRYRRVRELRRTQPLMMADFWCDGTLVGGCLSGGRVYFHVNADGGIEPCVFHQFSVDNVRDTSLLEALDSPYFRYLRGQLAEITNPLRPCPIVDRPEILRSCYQRFQPTPSQRGGEQTVTRLASGLDAYASELAQVFDPIWQELREGACRCAERGLPPCVNCRSDHPSDEAVRLGGSARDEAV